MAPIILGDINIDPMLRGQKFLTMALQTARSELEKAGAIQSFEICYELSWKLMKRILSYRGVEVNSPREAFRAAAKEKIIDELDLWFEFINKRNLTTHIYNPDIAEDIFRFLPRFAEELNLFIEKIRLLSHAQTE